MKTPICPAPSSGRSRAAPPGKAALPAQTQKKPFLCNLHSPFHQHFLGALTPLGESPADGEACASPGPLRQRGLQPVRARKTQIVTIRRQKKLLPHLSAPTPLRHANAAPAPDSKRSSALSATGPGPSLPSIRRSPQSNGAVRVRIHLQRAVRQALAPNRRSRDAVSFSSLSVTHVSYHIPGVLSTRFVTFPLDFSSQTVISCP